MNNKISVVFFGSPDIAVNSFVSLINSPDFEVKALVTQSPKPTGRGNKIKDSNIKKEAILNNIKVLEPIKLSKDEAALNCLREISPDFFVTFAYGQILSEEVLSIPKYETINLHASLLPKYRGSNPISTCLLNGDDKTGVTTMITVYELDAGDICIQKEIALDKNINYIELSNKISDISPDLIKETLKGLYNGSLKPVSQEHNLATFTKKMQKSDKLIDFDFDSDFVHNKIRALAGINTTHFVYNEKLIKVLSSETKDEKGLPGEVLNVNKEGVLISCKQGSVLIKQVKPEGKNQMSAYDWSLGSKIKKGDVIKCSQGE